MAKGKAHASLKTWSRLKPYAVVYWLIHPFIYSGIFFSGSYSVPYTEDTEANNTERQGPAHVKPAFCISECERDKQGR